MDPADWTAALPVDEEPGGVAEPEEERPRKLPPPLGILELDAVEEPKEEWLVEGFAPAGGNILVAGYPKTFKTLFEEDLAVSLASATPFLGRFPVPERRRVGLVLMEDQAHRVRRRLRRLCWGRGITFTDLQDWLYLWFRPPLRLTGQTVVELGRYAQELELDYLHVDSWAYVASGDSNSGDEVTPQLQALSECRHERPGLTVGLTQHARKERGETADASRLTDIIRNSSAFGAWYDAGFLLSRKDEASPVTVRSELRDFPSPEPFSFKVEDEDPAGPHNSHRSGGWLRLQAMDQRPELVEAEARCQRLAPAVEEYVAARPEGVTGRELEDGVAGRATDVRAAARWLEGTGKLRYDPPAGPGRAGGWYPISGGASQVRPGASGTRCAGGASDRVRPPYVVGAGADAPGTPSDGAASEEKAGRTSGHTCPDCGARIGPSAERCARCQYGAPPTEGETP